MGGARPGDVRVSQVSDGQARVPPVYVSPGGPGDGMKPISRGGPGDEPVGFQPGGDGPGHGEEGKEASLTASDSPSQVEGGDPGGREGVSNNLPMPPGNTPGGPGQTSATHE